MDIIYFSTCLIALLGVSGELARKLEARRSLIVHSDDDDWTEHQSTPKESGASKDSTPSDSLVLSPNHTARMEDTGESTPVKGVQESLVKSATMENQNGMAVEERAIPATVSGSQQLPDVTWNGNFVAEEKKTLYFIEKVYIAHFIKYM